MSVKILPCPFCGRKPKLTLYEGWWYLKCINDGHIASSYGHFWHISATDVKGLKVMKQCVQECIKDWNTRS